MPWEERKLKDLRRKFVQACSTEKISMSALCKEYGISRKTGYKWLNRYQTGEQLEDHSRRPLSSPNKTPLELEALIIQTRLSHPTWGARKLLRLLQNQGYHSLPCASTVCNILKRNGLVSPRASAMHTPYKRFERKHPNELWQMDFKGDFVMENGKRCYPLTLLDDHSRYSLCISAQPNQQWPGVHHALQELFQIYGLPDVILSDNGPPWGNGHRGITKFELWMMKLNILPIHGRAMHPQTQGKEERFHRTLKEDLLLRSSISDLAHAQRLFDAYRQEYNSVRPHAALDMATPDEFYAASSRKLPFRLEVSAYPSSSITCRVNLKGYVVYKGISYYISENLAEHTLAIRELPDDCIQFCYGNFEVAKYDLVEHLLISHKISRLDTL